jgi:hypothetical protein
MGCLTSHSQRDSAPSAREVADQPDGDDRRAAAVPRRVQDCRRGLVLGAGRLAPAPCFLVTEVGWAERAPAPGLGFVKRGGVSALLAEVSRPRKGAAVSAPALLARWHPALSRSGKQTARRIAPGWPTRSSTGAGQLGAQAAGVLPVSSENWERVRDVSVRPAGLRWSAVDGEPGDGVVEVVLGGQGVDPSRVESSEA